MALVLFNIGWMQYYRGQTKSDRIFNGGSYVKENKFGHEVENFQPIDDSYYGYVQPPGSGINLKNLGASLGATHVDDVTIVFTATRPEGGNVVVGWYRDARVWRDQKHRARQTYFAKAKRKNCRLLEVDERTHRVPRKGAWVMGRSNIRYVKDADESEDFVCGLRKYIEYMEAPSDLDLTVPVSQRGPRQPDPTRRAMVEKAAIEYVVKYYKGKGYECVSVEQENKGWDLQSTQGAVRLLVEVKGCSGDAGKVELTPNEYAAMRHHRHREIYRLAIVTLALDNPRLSIVRFNGSDKTWCDQDDRKVRLEERTGARVTCR